MTGSLSQVIDQLVALEETVAPGELRVYRWRPTTLHEAPAIYNWLDSSELESNDLMHFDEVLRLRVLVAMAHSDDDEEMAALEDYADRMRAVIDAALYSNDPLGGTCQFAKRTSMRTTLDTFNDVDYLCVEFVLELTLHRFIAPS